MHRTLYKHLEYESVRKSGITEKCIFCEHRVKKGEQPLLCGFLPGKGPHLRRPERSEQRAQSGLKKHKPVQLKNNKGALLKAGEKARSLMCFMSGATSL